MPQHIIVRIQHSFPVSEGCASGQRRLPRASLLHHLEAQFPSLRSGHAFWPEDNAHEHGIDSLNVLRLLETRQVFGYTGVIKRGLTLSATIH